MEKQMLFVRATLLNGSEIVSEFARLRGIRSLSSDVMSGRKAFPVWETVSEIHPESNEPCLVRRRRFVSGAQIVGMEVVIPDGNGDYTSEDRISDGPAGSHAFVEGEDLPEGAIAGVSYPCVVDPESGRRFITLDFDEGITHWVDPEVDESAVAVGWDADSDEDWDDEEGVN